MTTKKISPQFLKYLFFGALNTLITFLIYVVLIKLSVNYLIASSICYALGIVEGFIFNGLFVFNTKLKLSGLSKYSIVYVVSYIINIFMLYCFVNYFGFDIILSQIFVIIFVTLLNFKLVKWLVF
ncbi:MULTISPECIES: GtrA family protein [Francisella]|uniref:GtrA family protein n=1 Tax=Francisella marina TaxID=2249302 RepID=A0ABX5ZJ76_9GAMM|nr:MULTISPECIES: GtrA family protein [Francisella]QEO57424.1 GtrA family protein [Francisella marina]QEO58457.1 GtrA family protein [Francisella marina]